MYQEPLLGRSDRDMIQLLGPTHSRREYKKVIGYLAIFVLNILVLGFAEPRLLSFYKQASLFKLANFMGSMITYFNMCKNYNSIVPHQANLTK